jgi:pimeloyl-ACP methyl ester carboxylesterase
MESTASDRTIGTIDLRYRGGDTLELPDGSHLYYEVHGSGPHVTFINNTFQISPFWRDVTSRLEERWTIVTYDLRGQGASGEPGTFVAPAQHVQDLGVLLDHLGVERTALIGTSNSTWVARDFAAEQAQRLGALCLVGPTFSPAGAERRQRLMRGWAAALESSGMEGMFETIYPQVFGDRAVQRGGDGDYEAFQQLFLALNTTEQWQTTLAVAAVAPAEVSMLERINCPVLLMAGDGDLFASRSTLEDLAELFDDAVTAVIPYSGHVPFFDAPEAFEASLLAFLSDRYGR